MDFSCLTDVYPTSLFTDRRQAKGWPTFMLPCPASPGCGSARAAGRPWARSLPLGGHAALRPQLSQRGDRANRPGGLPLLYWWSPSGTRYTALSPTMLVRLVGCVAASVNASRLLRNQRRSYGSCLASVSRKLGGTYLLSVKVLPVTIRHDSLVPRSQAH